jgi:hypothetical protein
LQVIGTDIIRRHKPDWHLNSIKLSPNKKYCFDDLRFPNEKKFIESIGGICVYIDKESKLVDSHESENALSIDDFELVITNNVPIESFIHSSIEKLNL